MVNAWDNLHSATLELVRSTPIKQRLIAAYRRYLTTIAEEQLPSEARDSFTQVMRLLAGVQPLRGEDAVLASVRKMSNQQADDCAALIVEIFGAICRADSGLQRQSAASVVQLRSIERASEEFDVPALTATN
ncbi:MAG TPA: hypothetical protein VME42_05075 [Steroidobacteraceae bacterium]|nr:hypothetical protein [Steroidobacteraceae bacterium]